MKYNNFIIQKNMVKLKKIISNISVLNDVTLVVT